jgi:hypothetical protein
MSHHSYYTECTQGYTPKRGSSSSSRVAFVARSFAFTPSTFAIDRSIDRSFVPRLVVVRRPRAGPRNPRAGGTTRDRGGDEGTVPSSRDGDGDDDDDDAWCGVRTTSSPSTSARVVSRTRRLVVSTLTSTRTRDGRLRVTSRRVEFVFATRCAACGQTDDRRDVRRDDRQTVRRFIRSSVRSFVSSKLRSTGSDEHRASRFFSRASNEEETRRESSRSRTRLGSTTPTRSRE